MMRSDVFFAYSICKMVRYTLDQPSSVYEDESRAVLVQKLGDAVVNLIPHLIGCDRAEKRVGNFNSQVEFAFVANVDDDRIRPSISGEKLRHLLDWLLCGREPNADRRTIGQSFQTLKRKRQVRAAFVVRDSVDLVDNYCLNLAQNGATAFGSQQNVERFGRGDEDVRRRFEHG